MSESEELWDELMRRVKHRFPQETHEQWVTRTVEMKHVMDQWLIRQVFGLSWDDE